MLMFGRITVIMHKNIIERDNDIKLSMEILVDEYSYNAKQRFIILQLIAILELHFK